MNDGAPICGAAIRKKKDKMAKKGAMGNNNEAISNRVH